MGLTETEAKAFLSAMKEKFIVRRIHPLILFIDKNQDDLIAEYDKGILNLYQYLCNTLGISKAGSILKTELKDIIKEILLHQVSLSTNNGGSKLQDLINLKQLEGRILSWLKGDFVGKKSIFIPSKPAKIHIEKGNSK